MSTDYKGKIMYSMTQAKFNELREANGGKLPAQYANSYVYTDAEDVNLSQMRTEVLWTNPNPTASFSAQTVTFENNETFDYFLIISRYNINVNSYVSHFGEVGKGIHITDVRAKSGSHFAMYERSATTTQTSVTFSDADEQYTDGSFVVSNITLVPYQIIGLKKTPAMIYTGAELYEGDGIKIENGVISQAPRNIAINSYYIGSYPEIIANASNSEASVVSVTINKRYETSKLLVMSSVPIKNNDQGWGGGTSIKIDGVTKCIKRVVSYSGDVNLDWLIPDISSGVHTVSLNVLYGGGGAGAGSVSMPQYSNAIIIVEEVLV